MKHASLHKKWDRIITVIVLTLTGCMLAALHFLLVFLPFNNVIEALLLAFFGYIFGKKVYGSNWIWGILLALPALLLLLYRISSSGGGTSIGVEPYLMLFLLPLASCLGMYLRIHHHHHKHNLVDEHFLND